MLLVCQRVTGKGRPAKSERDGAPSGEGLLGLESREAGVGGQQREVSTCWWVGEGMAGRPR